MNRVGILVVFVLACLCVAEGFFTDPPQAHGADPPANAPVNPAARRALLQRQIREYMLDRNRRRHQEEREEREKKEKEKRKDKGGKHDGGYEKDGDRHEKKDKDEHKDEDEHKEDEHKEGEHDEDHGGQGGGQNGGGGINAGSYVVLGYNDLGMHCMNKDFSRLCILPPYNNLHAQVIRRGEEPHIVTQGVEVKYSIPSNTFSVGKTDFWQWAPRLFNVNLPPNIGLTGNGLAGNMQPTGNNDWSATGIPVTPVDDNGLLNAYPISNIQVVANGQPVASTHAVVPVSWEISCNLCHPTNSGGAPASDADVEYDILRQHDRKHNTQLEVTARGGQPILCAGCHADPALGTTGVPGVSSLSHAMHGSHAERVRPLLAMGKNACYACHPGFQTNCQRDVHFARRVYCTQCHGDMNAVANPVRVPWVSQPTCGSCHAQRRPEFEFEEPGKLFKDSRGHGNVHCAACHGSPHAVGPAVTAQDNLQAMEQQGFAGPIAKCTVCHTSTPRERFEHKRDD